MKTKQRKTSRHHRICKSHKDTIKGNIVTVRHDHHQHFHGLFNNMYPHQIAAELNRRWIDPRLAFITIKVKYYDEVTQFLNELEAKAHQSSSRNVYHLPVLNKAKRRV